MSAAIYPARDFGRVGLKSFQRDHDNGQQRVPGGAPAWFQARGSQNLYRRNVSGRNVYCEEICISPLIGCVTVHDLLVSGRPLCTDLPGFDGGSVSAHPNAPRFASAAHAQDTDSHTDDPKAVVRDVTSETRHRTSSVVRRRSVSAQSGRQGRCLGSASCVKLPRELTSVALEAPPYWPLLVRAPHDGCDRVVP